MATASSADDCFKDTNGIRNAKRVRTGCVTCRKRKVKCDESKPACERCRATNWPCEYKEPPPPKIRVRRSKYSLNTEFGQSRQVERVVASSSGMHTCSSSPPLIAPRITIARTSEDCHSFDYFRMQAVEDISGCFDWAFWDSFVLPACHTEPSIWHAVLALSALHESYQVQHLNSQFDVGEKLKFLKNLALKQYTKAVSLLVNGISRQQLRLPVVHLSCVIFIWVEFVQDNIDSALRHLKCGLNLLAESQNSNLTAFVDEPIVQLLTRLHTQVIVHGHRSYDSKANAALTYLPKYKGNPPAFKDFLEARIHLETHMANIFTFHRQTEDPGFVQDRVVYHPFPDPLSIEAICQSYGRSLQEWQAAIKKPFTGSFDALSTRERIALAQLELQCLLTADSLSTALTTSQMIYDEHRHEYERMLSLVETLMERSRNKVHIVSFDMGVLTALFYLVLKCRDLDLRTRAIDLMKQAPPREGLWRRQSVVEFAEWKVRKEEEGRRDADPTGKLPHHARIYAEGARKKVIDGKQVTVILYKRGSDVFDGKSDFEEEVTTLCTDLANVLGST